MHGGLLRARRLGEAVTAYATPLAHQSSPQPQTVIPSLGGGGGACSQSRVVCRWSMSCTALLRASSSLIEFCTPDGRGGPSCLIQRATNSNDPQQSWLSLQEGALCEQVAAQVAPSSGGHICRLGRQPPPGTEQPRKMTMRGDKEHGAEQWGKWEVLERRAVGDFRRTTGGQGSGSAWAPHGCQAYAAGGGGTAGRIDGSPNGGGRPTMPTATKRTRGERRMWASPRLPRSAPSTPSMTPGRFRGTIARTRARRASSRRQR